LRIVKKLIVIGGATATGKTALAIKLAQHFGTEIISADSRQFYRGMSIGTAKPNAEELAAAKHHFIDSLDVTQSYSVGEFEQDCLRLLDTLFLTHDYVILVGGSGLFIRAVCEGLDSFPEVPEAVIQQVEDGEKNGGLPWLQQQVQQLDPEYFKQVDRNNPARLRRALEVCLAAAQPYSSFRSGQKQTRPFQPVYLLLDVPRPTLYARIDARVDAMISAGLENEARNLLPFRHLSALRTVGYEEFFDYFDENLTFLEAVDKIKQHSRNYAKRQATWFRKHGDWEVIDPSDALAKIVEIID
jgi:tRNA dimethylallyltransferase